MEKKSPRERVLSAASLLFHQKGYNSTGINAIIQEAKVAKASFYDHYKTKDDLAVEYLKFRHDYWFKGLIDKVNSCSLKKEKIVAAFTYIIEMNEKENFKGCAFLNMLSEIPENQGEIYDVISMHKVELQSFFTTLVEEESKAFMLYMLFEACLTESQVVQNSNCVYSVIKLINEGLL